MSETQTSFTPRVFSGVQPSGGLTLGNYLGAVRNWSTMLENNECYFGIVDLHAITTPTTPATLRQNVFDCVAQYVACGLDPEKCHQFVQSHVIGHTELAWVLTCLTPIGELQRMTQFKDKAGKNAENASLGLFGYPALMAADILAYHATHVPVGDDQKQHLELTRDIAIKFNHDFGVDFFPVIEPVIGGPAARVMSLRDGSKKMSKSDPSDLSRINMGDDADVANRRKRMRTVFGFPTGIRTATCFFLNFAHNTHISFFNNRKLPPSGSFLSIGDPHPLGISYVTGTRPPSYQR